MSDRNQHHHRRLRLAATAAAVLVMTAGVTEHAVAGVTVKPTARGYDIDIDSPTNVSELMDAIAGATGVEVKGEPEDATVGPDHLRDTSLERALRKLLPKAPFAVRFDDDDTPEAIIFLSPSQHGDSTDGSDSEDGTESSDEAPEAPDDSAPDSGG